MSSKSLAGAYVFHFSGTEKYTVAFNVAGESLLSHCSCPKGDTASLCHHRVSILSGSTAHIPENEHELQQRLIAKLASSSKGKQYLLKVRTQASNGKFCPNCNSTAITVVKAPVLKRILARIQGRRFPYRCDTCGYKW